jgi:HPr kinase/phosphorylase
VNPPLHSFVEILYVSRLLDDLSSELGLVCLSGSTGITKIINTPVLRCKGFLPEKEECDESNIGCIRIFSPEDFHDFDKLSGVEKQKHIDSFFKSCSLVVYANGIDPCQDILSYSEIHGITLCKTTKDIYSIIQIIDHYLSIRLTRKTELAGSMVDVFGVGMFLRGESGIGKSECVLDLVARGHRMIADNRVFVFTTGNGMLLANAHPDKGHFMDIRNIGLVDTGRLFGINSVRLQKRLEVVVTLVNWNKTDNYERIGDETQYTEILGIKIPEIILPISPGKEISTLLEVISRNLMLNVYGENPAIDFINQLDRLMSMPQKPVLKPIKDDED